MNHTHAKTIKIILSLLVILAFFQPPPITLASPQSTPLVFLPLILSSNQTPAPNTYALRFYGNGTGDIDRVKIPVVQNNTSLPMNIGATDFTIEFWMRFVPNENQSGACVEGNDTWINGNIIFDRDIFGTPDYGDFGISLYGGKIAFGVHNGSTGYSICGNTLLSANTWHHIAVTRTTTGVMRIFVNGNLDRSYANGPTGNISYRPGRSITGNYVNEPYLVIGAEKHDYDPNNYPSFSGWIDEVRISKVVRYSSNFTPPNAPFTGDSNTVGLYHFDEGSGTILTDSSGATGGPSHGILNFGGSPPGPVFDPNTKRF